MPFGSGMKSKHEEEVNIVNSNELFFLLFLRFMLLSWVTCAGGGGWKFCIAEDFSIGELLPRIMMSKAWRTLGFLAIRKISGGCNGTFMN